MNCELSRDPNRNKLEMRCYERTSRYMRAGIVTRYHGHGNAVFSALVRGDTSTSELSWIFLCGNQRLQGVRFITDLVKIGNYLVIGIRVK
jgi:hypothetical protein